VDISIPQTPPGTAAKKEAESNPEGLALMAKVVEALGGAEKVQAVKTVRQKATLLFKTPGGEIPIEADGTILFPDTTYMKLETPMGERVTVISPGSSFVGMGGETQDMPASMKEETLKQLRRNLIYVAQHAADPKFTFAATGTEKIGDVEARILEINADGAEARWYVDPQSGKVLRTAFEAAGRAGPTLRVTDNLEWMTVDGITLPSKQSISENGQASGSSTVKELVINPTVDPKLFERPAVAKP